MPVKKLNVFITGARGFVGKNIVEYLIAEHRQKYKLFHPVHKELDLLDAEAVASFIKKNKIDVIIHCANVGGSRKTAYDSGQVNVVEANLRMFFNMVRCMDRVRKMIHFGTGAEYDMRYYVPMMKEERFDVRVPVDPYGFSKYIMSKYIENSQKIVCLRIFGMFGKYEDHEYKFITNSIVKNLFHLPIVINQNVRFDYMYINDCVQLVEKAIGTKFKHKAYNLTTGRTIDLVSIAQKINEISDFESEIIIKNPGLNKEYSGDNSRLMKDIKFKFTPMETAVKELFSYYRSLLPNIDRKRIETDEFIKYCKTSRD